MKELPEIAPEIRGLLEEIVKDPRSSMRLAPRRALLSWFDTGETLRPREVSLTSLERHLVEAYREDLAQILYEGAVIAYWKAAELMHRPLGPDGRIVDPVAEEPEWVRRAAKRTGVERAEKDGVALVAACLGGIRPQQAHSLAQASLSLVPSDRTRCYVAMSLRDEQPRTAIASLERLASQAHATSLLPHVLRYLGARLCTVARYSDARAAYQESFRIDPAVVGVAYSFNLSCVMGEEASALREAELLDEVATAETPRLLEARGIIHQWLRERPAEAYTAKGLAHRISTKVSEPARILCGAYKS